MPMTLRLTPAETEALREAAKRERRSMQAVARDLDDLLAAAEAAIGGPADVRDIGVF